MNRGWGSGTKAQDTWHERQNTGCESREPDYREQTTENRQKDWVVVPELEAPLITEDSWEKAAATLAGKSPAIIPALVQYLGIKDVLVSRTLEETFKKIGQRDVGSIHNLVQQQDMESSQENISPLCPGQILQTRSRKTCF